MTATRATPDALLALGDQVQQACDASGLVVYGFIIISTASDTQLAVEARSMVERRQLMLMLAAYLNADASDG